MRQISASWAGVAIVASIATAVGALVGSACGSNHNGTSDYQGSVLRDGAIAATAACVSENGTTPVAQPVFVRNIQTDETGWLASPAVVDLDGDGKNEIVAALYSTFVFSGDGKLLAKGTLTQDRIYAPHIVADLDGDGKPEIVVGGSGGTVAAYNYANGKLTTKWTASTTSGGQSPDASGMAAGDLDHDGQIEVVVTTDNMSDTGSQVFVFEPDGKPRAGWPRYNQKSPGDLDFNGQGNHGYACDGENVGIGNIDDDDNLEIVVTFDNHYINAFKADGSSILASDWYTNPDDPYLGQRMGWGQFIRWLDPTIEDNLYHAHIGPWPEVTTNMWLQWTASPPNVVDLDGDGKNEVVGIPNAELHDPYVTQGYAFMVLEGAYGDGSRSARRKAGFETLPMSDQPPVRLADDWYPPDGTPAPTTVNIVGDAKLEILAPINDGYIYAIGADGSRLWRYDFAKGADKTFASEVTVADLNKDGVPEIIFGVYSLAQNGGRIVVLKNTGELLFDITLPNQGTDGNGIGVPAAPTIADIDGDGQLEILAQTFDHGIDVFTVPGSGTSCMLWPTARGSYLRAGSGPALK
ncbi:MAG: VCBS repeat-containing protein [Polyangiaceae bacterium]|nr:VCBS repeat-containing protein [Polyangiaceae bacterium]